MAARVPLTPRQAKLFTFIAGRLDRGEPCPTFAEMAAHLGATSNGHVARLVDGLIKRGHLIKLRAHARALRLAPSEQEVRLPCELVAKLERAARCERIAPQILVARAVERYLGEVA